MTKFWQPWGKPFKITRFKRGALGRRPWTMCFSYAGKPSGPILKYGHKWWQDINGIGIFLPKQSIWIEFRRFDDYPG